MAAWLAVVVAGLSGLAQVRGAGSATSTSGGSWYRTSHALIIGINDYSGGMFGKLNYAEADAKKLRELLVGRFEFANKNVVLLLGKQATGQNIRSELARLADRRLVSPEDRIIVFFAGHGHTIRNDDGGEAGYLIPSDAQIKMEDADNPGAFLSSAVSMRQVWEYLGPSSARHILVVADACFSGLLAQTRSGTGLSQESIDAQLLKRARQVFTAGGRGEQSRELQSYGQGLFSYHLIRELNLRADSGGVFSFQSLASSVNNAVSRESSGKQNPQFATLDTEGDVLFRSSNPIATPKPPAAQPETSVPGKRIVSSIIVENKPIKRVMELLARAGKFSYAIDPSVDSLVTLEVEERTVDEALKDLCAQLACEYRWDGTTCRIARPALKDTSVDPVIPKFKAHATISQIIDSLSKWTGLTITLTESIGEREARIDRTNVKLSELLRGLTGLDVKTSGRTMTVKSTRAGDTIIPSIVFTDVAVRDVLRSIFKSAGVVSYTIAQDVQGTVTLSLSNVPLDVALRATLNQVNATYRVEGGIYNIILKELTPPRPLSHN